MADPWPDAGRRKHRRVNVLTGGAVTIRPLALGDVEAVAELEAEAFPTAQWTVGHLRDVVERPAWPFLVATRDGVVVGFAAAAAATEEADILTVAVARSERRRGIGTALVEALEEELTRRGVVQITLEVRRSNRAARSLYRAAGYVEVGERSRYYPDGEDAVVMRKG